MTRDEDELAVFGARFAPLEEVFRTVRLVVFIGAEERDIEVVSRVSEVVGVAAEEPDAFFGREDEAHVGKLFVAVQMILSALIHGDDVAAQAFFRLGVRFELLNELGARLFRLFKGLAVFHGGFDLVRDVDDLLERD